MWWLIIAPSSHNTPPGQDMGVCNFSSTEKGVGGSTLQSQAIRCTFSTKSTPSPLLYCLRSAVIKKGTYAGCQSSCQHLLFLSQMLCGLGGQSSQTTFSKKNELCCKCLTLGPFFSLPQKCFGQWRQEQFWIKAQNRWEI